MPASRRVATRAREADSGPTSQLARVGSRDGDEMVLGEMRDQAEEMSCKSS